MDRILIIIFLLAVLPYLGIPNRYDVWIVFLLAVFLIHAIYLFTQKHDLLPGSKSTEDSSQDKTTKDKD